MGRGLEAVVPAVLCDIRLHRGVADHLRFGDVDRALILGEGAPAGDGAGILIVLADGGVPDGAAQDAADIVHIAFQPQRRGELAAGDHLLPLLALVPAQQVLRQMQVEQLLLEEGLPELADAAVGLGLGAAPVEPALDVLVDQQVFQPGQPGVEQAAVLRYVLLLHHPDLLIEAAAGLLGPEGGGVHIIVHGLLLGGGDDVGRQQVDDRRLRRQHGPADGVEGVAVMGDGRPSRHDLGVAAHQVLGFFAGGGVQIVGVPVEVVKVLQQGKVERALDVGAAHPLRQMGGQVDRQLLVADGVFQGGLVGGFQVGQQFLLLLFAAAQQSQLTAQLVVPHAARELMAEPDVLELGAVHQDDAGACVRVGLPLVVGPGPELFPVEKKPGG